MRFQRFFGTVLTITGLLLCLPFPASAEDHALQLEWSAGAAWDTRYVSEGRNNLPEGGLLTAEAGVGLSGVSLTAAYSFGDKEKYQEVNVSIEYGYEVSGLDLYGGYTRLEFPEDSTNDNEIGAGASFALPIGPAAAIDWVYSTEAKGSFVELTLSFEKGLPGGLVTVTPYILQGLDFSYATPDNDGLNNFQAGIEASVSVSDKVSVVGHIAHSWAQKDVEEDGLGGVSWGGLGIAVEF